nr:retrovirus-related Pol polyprotein from transposon TNT 1-94 [Tanacetum cinerariifolium]
MNVLHGASPSSEIMPLNYQEHSLRERGTMKHTKPDTQKSSSKNVSGHVTVCTIKPIITSVPTEVENNEHESKINELTKLVQMLVDERVNSSQKIYESKSVIPHSESFKSVNSFKMSQESKPKSMEAIRFTNTLVDEIGIYNSSRYPPNEFLHKDDPSRQYQANSNISDYITPHDRSLNELTQTTDVPKVITLNEHTNPLTEDIRGPFDVINTEGTPKQTVLNEQTNNQPTEGYSGNYAETSLSITELSVLKITQSPIIDHASTSLNPTPQDRWSRDKHIKLVNIIGEPSEGMLTRIMAAKLIVSLASECLFAYFFFEIKPKKVFEALKHPAWKDPIIESQEMLMSNTHQQSLADACSETRPLMVKGPYEFRVFTLSETEAPRMQKEEDLRGDDLKHYEVEIEAMNLILISIPNGIYNSVDACKTTKAMWQWVEQTGKCIKSKKVEKSHDPFTLVAHTSSSYRATTPYYVTHPSSVVDYDDDYQGDALQNNYEDSLTSAMILLARSITQRFSNPTNNHLRTSSNTRNQAIVQGDRVNIRSTNSRNDGRNIIGSYVKEEIIKGHYARNCLKPRVQDSKYFMKQMLLAKQDEAGVILTNEQNDFLFADASRMEEIEELSTNICLMSMIQQTNFDFDEGPSYDFAFLNEVQTPSTSYDNPLFAKDAQEQKYLKQPKIINTTIGDDQIDTNIIFVKPNGDVNSGSVEYDNNVQESYALEQLAKNTYKEAEK